MKKIKKILSLLGPGFITGASDDDPSGIGTYSQTGALFGFSQLWTALFSFPFMTAVQEMCGRIGIVTGKGLAGVIRIHYPKQILYICVALLLLANTVNIGADLGAMASSGQLIFGVPYVFWLLFITGLSIILQIFVPYRVYARFLKYFAFSLLAYIVCAFIVKLDWSQVIYSTFIPKISLSKEYLFNIAAILGTTISPYLFFWQASEEVEEEVQKHELRSMGAGIPKFSKSDLKSLRIDTVLGMFFSNLVMYFIILTTASTLGSSGITSIQTADQAAEALRPFAGDFAYLIFAMGIIGTGFLAIPVLAGSTAYAVSECFGFKEGLYRKFRQAEGFYLIITIATLVGLFINFASIPPFTMLYYTAILNGICAPPLLIMIMLISNNKRIMKGYTNGSWSNLLGWGITIVMTVNTIAVLFSLL